MLGLVRRVGWRSVLLWIALSGINSGVRAMRGGPLIRKPDHMWRVVSTGPARHGARSKCRLRRNTSNRVYMNSKYSHALAINRLRFACKACPELRGKCAPRNDWGEPDATCPNDRWDGMPVVAENATPAPAVPAFLAARQAACNRCLGRAQCERWKMIPACGGLARPEAVCPADPPRWLTQPITPSKEIPDGR